MSNTDLGTNIPNEKTISLKAAVAIIVLILAVLTGIGIYVGDKFFWNNFQLKSEAERKEELAQQKVSKNGKNPDALVALGWSYVEQGKYKEGIELFNNALKLKPDHIQAKYNMGIAYLELKEYDKAKPLLEEYVKKFPMMASGRSVLGYLYLDTKEYSKAIEQFKEANKIRPGDTNVLYLTAQAYEKIGEKDNAIAFYKKTLDYNPMYTEANTALKSLGVNDYKPQGGHK